MRIAESLKEANRPFPLKVMALLLVVSVMSLLAACKGEVPEEELEPTRTPKPTFTAYPTMTLVPTVTPQPTATPTATPDAQVNPLTGYRVDDPEILRRRVLAVRVGNDPSIRPQEGLGQAEIVYEEIMEGRSVTRFTALFLAAEADRIRPVRSARLVNLDIVPQYDAALAHSGASDEIRWRISQADFVDLDEYFHPDPYGLLSGYDWRGRQYTSVEALRDYLNVEGLEADSRIDGYSFDAEPPEGERADSIQIPYPRSCAVTWEYDGESGGYLRWVQGEPHLDGLTDEQIQAENVVILYAPHYKTDIVEDSLGNTAIDIALREEEGPVQVCRDGVCATGTWYHEAPDELILYYDRDGREIPLKQGKTWIELVLLDYEIVLDDSGI